MTGENEQIYVDCYVISILLMHLVNICKNKFKKKGEKVAIFIVYTDLLCCSYWRNLRKPCDISSHHNEIYRFRTFPLIYTTFGECYVEIRGQKRCEKKKKKDPLFFMNKFSTIFRNSNDRNAKYGC